MTHDPPEGVVRFIKGADEVAYKMPHKIEQYDSLSDLQKEYTKSVYLRNKEDKRRGVEYAISKILGFYKEFLELGPEYLTGMDDEGEVTLYLMRRSLEVLRKFHWMILGERFSQVIMQQVHGRQGQSYSGTGYKSNATSSGGNNVSEQKRVVICYNCQGEGHMDMQCTQLKRPRNAT
ncbi:protein kinase-like domain, concanavalin A-like lectin/glucanase domain protein [Tanacetum coccineum]